MGEADHAEIQQNISATDMGTNVAAMVNERRKVLKEKEQIGEDYTGLTAQAKGKALKTNLNGSNYGKSPSAATVGGKKSENLAVFMLVNGIK
jgi:hypothetical protein